MSFSMVVSKSSADKMNRIKEELINCPMAAGMEVAIKSAEANIISFVANNQENSDKDGQTGTMFETEEILSRREKKIPIITNKTIRDNPWVLLKTLREAPAEKRPSINPSCATAETAYHANFKENPGYIPAGCEACLRRYPEVFDQCKHFWERNNRLYWPRKVAARKIYEEYRDRRAAMQVEKITKANPTETNLFDADEILWNMNPNKLRIYNDNLEPICEGVEEIKAYLEFMNS